MFDSGMVFVQVIQLGIGFYLGVAVCAWAALLVVYIGSFPVLGTVQICFAAVFMIPLAVLGGVGYQRSISPDGRFWVEKSPQGERWLTGGAVL